MGGRPAVRGYENVDEVIMGGRTTTQAPPAETCVIEEEEALDKLAQIVGLLFPGATCERLTVDGKDPFIVISNEAHDFGMLLQEADGWAYEADEDSIELPVVGPICCQPSLRQAAKVLMSALVTSYITMAQEAILIFGG